MKPSPTEKAREMYDETASSYSEMMDTEIECQIYSDTLKRLHKRIENAPGTLIDTSCGSGHMLSRYHDRYDQSRQLLGFDLSPRMVSIAGKRLGANAKIMIGDMRDLSIVDSGSAVAVLSFFSVHHLDPTGVRLALREWHRVLRPGGQLLIAAWEGVGAIDYGNESNIVALRYRSNEIASWTREAGFTVTRCDIEPVEEIPMDAIYLEGGKA